MESLNKICAAMTKAETLNALHACRDGHPLGRVNPFKWRNACALVEQADYFERREIWNEMDWLRNKARDEAGETK